MIQNTLMFKPSKQVFIKNHFIGLSETAVEIEMKYFSLIHPDCTKKIPDLLSQYESFYLNNQSYENIYPNEGGVYIFQFTDNSYYVGETLNFTRRFSEHLTSLKNKNHYNHKLQKIFDKERKIKVYIPVHAKLEEDVKMFFKFYCLMREHYFQELFYNNAKLLNEENSLKKLYDYSAIRKYSHFPSKLEEYFQKVLTHYPYKHISENLEETLLCIINYDPCYYAKPKDAPALVRDNEQETWDCFRNLFYNKNRE